MVLVCLKLFILLHLSVTQSPREGIPKGGDNDSLGGGRILEFNEHLLFDPGVTRHTAESLVLVMLFWLLLLSALSPPFPFLLYLFA